MHSVNKQPTSIKVVTSTTKHYDVGTDQRDNAKGSTISLWRKYGILGWLLTCWGAARALQALFEGYPGVVSALQVSWVSTILGGCSISWMAYVLSGSVSNLAKVIGYIGGTVLGGLAVYGSLTELRRVAPNVLYGAYVSVESFLLPWGLCFGLLLFCLMGLGFIWHIGAGETIISPSNGGLSRPSLASCNTTASSPTESQHCAGN